MSKTKTLLDEDTKSFREAKKLALSPFRRRKLMAAIRSDATVTRSALVTLEALLDHAGDDAHKCWPSQERLAEMTHVHVSTIKRHTKELAKAGHILVYGSKAR